MAEESTPVSLRDNEDELSFCIPDKPDKEPLKRVQDACLQPKKDGSVDALNESIDKTMATCCQVRIIVSEPYWTLQALNIHGTLNYWKINNTTFNNAQQVPLDEFYIVYHTHAQAVGGNRPLAIAVATPMIEKENVVTILPPKCYVSQNVQQYEKNDNDNCDSVYLPCQYRLQFISSPYNGYLSAKNKKKPKHQKAKPAHISIFFQYSSGIGQMPPPAKDSWNHGGTSHTVYLKQNVPQKPIIEPFVNPNGNKTIDLSEYDDVLAFGDSVMEHWVNSRRRILSNLSSEQNERNHCRNIQYGTKVAMPLHSGSIDEILLLLHESHGKQLDLYESNETKSSKKMALIIGSAMWDILSDDAVSVGPEFEQHLAACRIYVEQIRSKYPHVDLYWLLPTAVHIHRVRRWCLGGERKKQDLSEDADAAQVQARIHRVRYMSASRTYDLCQKQKALLHDDLQVPVLDIYHATYLSADWTLPGDGRHYQPELNEYLLNLFYHD